MKIVLISDTHGLHDELLIPDGDILVHTGDISMKGTIEDIANFNSWINTLPHRHKIVIAGNHDFAFQNQARLARKALTNCHYLQDSLVNCEGIKIYGSPWQPWFENWAFNLERGAEIKKMWNLIPPDTDLLLTHGPPFGILDEISPNHQVGCKDLLDRVLQIKPKFHVFGHIHQAYGQIEQDEIKFINCSICDVDYNPKNAPIVIDL